MKRYFNLLFILIVVILNVDAQDLPKSSPCSYLPTFTDPRDGKIYNTVQINNQCWMKENLNIGSFISSSVNQTNNDIIEKYCINNIEALCNTYGGLYFWDEMMQYDHNQGSPGICPAGWHVPTDNEWCDLTAFLDASVDCSQIGNLGTYAGGFLKETGTIHWNVPNTGADNSSGFNGLPGGYYTNTDQSFNNKGCYGFFHSSSSNGLGQWTWFLSSAESSVSRASYISGAFSVRCLRNSDWTPQLNVTPVNPNISPAAGTVSLSVTSNISWEVSENVGWLYATPLNGVNNALIEVVYEANQSTEPRTGQITIASDNGNLSAIVTITQAGIQWACGQPFPDSRDGKSYQTVQIGNQCWMKENLNIGVMVNSFTNQTNNGIIEKYCTGNSETNCNIYGGLYQWDEMLNYDPTPGVQGICMQGWHVPTDQEYTNLVNYLGGESSAGGKMKTTGTYEAGTGLWLSPNTGATNSSGFSALPGGRLLTDGSFTVLGRNAYLWSSTPYDYYYGWGRLLYHNAAYSNRVSNSKPGGCAVRCVKN